MWLKEARLGLHFWTKLPVVPLVVVLTLVTLNALQPALNNDSRAVKVPDEGAWIVSSSSAFSGSAPPSAELLVEAPTSQELALGEASSLIASTPPIKLSRRR